MLPPVRPLRTPGVRCGFYRILPDFNPIELAFQAEGVAAPTFQSFIEAIGVGVACITPADIVGYYRAALRAAHMQSTQFPTCFAE